MVKRAVARTPTTGSFQRKIIINYSTLRHTMPCDIVNTRRARPAIGLLGYGSVAAIALVMVLVTITDTKAMTPLAPPYAVLPCGNSGTSSITSSFGSYVDGGYNYFETTGTVDLNDQEASAASGESYILTQGGEDVGPAASPYCIQHGSTTSTVSITLSGTWIAYPYLQAACVDTPPTPFANASYILQAQADAWDSSNGAYQFGQYHVNSTIASYGVQCNTAHATQTYSPTSVTGLWSITLTSFSMPASSWWSFYVGITAYNYAFAYGDATAWSELQGTSYGAQVVVTSITCSAC
jgi:hypothetical protein